MNLVELGNNFFTGMRRLDKQMYPLPLAVKIQNMTPEERDEVERLDKIITETYKLNGVDWTLPVVNIITTSKKVIRATPFVKEFYELTEIDRPLPRSIYFAAQVQGLELLATGFAIIYGLSKFL